MIRIFSAGILIIAFFVSCAASVEESEVKDETLKSSAENFERISLWSNEIEADILKEKLPGIKNVSSKTALSPASVALAFIDSKSVFPNFKDSFGLDISSMDKEALKILDSFFYSFEKNEDCEKYFEAESLYSLVIFLHDFSEIKANVLNHVAGEPFFSDGIYQCPVRIFLKSNDKKNSSADIYAYLKKIDQEWKIFQLEIFSWNKNS
ncbi:hypothetical protein [Treponema succinifaciens]|uniref:hypothetical protein n=1 Tax=Treponema TaxID=157 RepID=UPI0025CBAD40|nr:hypothetical protein [Treponema succinifaciens]MDY2615345.1 hypothetical protein [Treponema succinifaciens]MEE0352442.1 hypothetical protein [Treponema sp.]